MSTVRISIVAACVALALLFVILELIRSRRLQERYAILWLITAATLLVMSVWRSALIEVSDLIGIAYPPTALFVLASLFIFAVLLHYSTVISQLSDQNRILAQRLALLENRFGEREAAADS
jgi:hypothetical protein